MVGETQEQVLKALKQMLLRLPSDAIPASNKFDLEKFVFAGISSKVL